MRAREARITGRPQHPGREEAVSRGQLLVYLGYAPGVGTTCAFWWTTWPTTAGPAQVTECAGRMSRTF